LEEKWCPENGNVDPKASAEPVSGSILPNRNSSKFDILHLLPYHFAANTQKQKLNLLVLVDGIKNCNFNRV